MMSNVDLERLGFLAKLGGCSKPLRYLDGSDSGGRGKSVLVPSPCPFNEEEASGAPERWVQDACL